MYQTITFCFKRKEKLIQPVTFVLKKRKKKEIESEWFRLLHLFEKKRKERKKKLSQNDSDYYFCLEKTTTKNNLIHSESDNYYCLKKRKKVQTIAVSVGNLSQWGRELLMRFNLFYFILFFKENSFKYCRATMGNKIGELLPLRRATQLLLWMRGGLTLCQNFDYSAVR